MYTTAIILTAIGSINWGFVALFDVNLVTALFGANTVLSNLVYIIVAVAALYVLVRHFATAAEPNVGRERYHRPATSHR